MKAYVKPEMTKNVISTNEEIAAYEKVGEVTTEDGYSVTTYNVSSFSEASN